MLEDDDGEFMEAGYQFKDHEVRKLLEEMLEGESFEILTKVEQRQVLKVLKHEGISAEGEATMPRFMGSKGGI